MATLPIVKDLDVLKNGLLSLLERLVRVQICPFSFEGTCAGYLVHPSEKLVVYCELMYQGSQHRGC